jgi:AraC-like DNA-binding protein
MDRRKSYIRSSDNHCYLVIFASQRTFNLEHGRYRTSSAGGISLLDNGRPFLGAHPEGLDIINVSIPRSVLEQAVEPARSITEISIDATQTSFPIITSYLATLIKHGAALDPVRQARMASIAVELIATGFAEKMEADPPLSLSGAALLCRAQAFINDHIGVEGLSINDVAAALNISVGRLQEVASAENVALMDRMWERRLQLAHAKLADLANIVMPVGLIACQCGFASQAHFSRRFKERFGQMPTEFKLGAGPQRGRHLAAASTTSAR